MNDNIVLLIILAVLAMLFLALAVVLFVVHYQKRITTINLLKEKELTEAAIRAEEEERMRIAAELHDDVGATLSSVKFYLQMGEKEATPDVFLQSQQLIDESISKVRSLSHRLQPAMLLQLGLQDALQSFFAPFQKNGSIHIEYTSDKLPPLPDNMALTAYRIVQELLNNTLKHATATHAEVYTEVADGQLCLCFSHNGQGITEAQFQQYIYKKEATGLKNIINRLKVVNGTIAFEQEKNWYHTIVRIPL
jgi:two-component system, NarL family, sensor kinase